MKNVKEKQLKNCIVVSVAEMENILEKIYGEKITVHVSLDGLWYEAENIDVDDESLLLDLANYFDVKQVTSVHCDDCDYVGIWICYN